MRYFTNNPLERLMMQKPKAVREDSPMRSKFLRKLSVV